MTGISYSAGVGSAAAEDEGMLLVDISLEQAENKIKIAEANRIIKILGNIYLFNFPSINP